MAKASRFYKQPKMKQKDYFETLERQNNLAHVYEEPRLLHQLKLQRAGSSVRRSQSDVSYRSAPPSIQQSLHYKNHNNNINSNNNNNNVKRSFSDVTYRQEKPKQIPFTKNKKEHKQMYLGSSVQRSHSDSVRLVRYRNNDTSVSRTNYVRERPASVDLTRHHSAGHYDRIKRPASVDLTPRPRSILKKSPSSSDLNSNRSFEEDLIFDDEYLDYVSPRDILSNNNPNEGEEQRLNFSFEDEVSRNHVTHTRPMSPNIVKRVNFKNELTYFRGSAPPGNRNQAEVNFFSTTQNRTRLKGPPRNQHTEQHQVESPSLRSLPGNHQVYNGATAQPYEIRKPLFTDNNVVDFGTFISKKLSKLKFKNRKKGSDSVGRDKKVKPQGFETQNGVRTSTDGNFTMLSRSARSPRRKEDFMTEEILY